MLNMALRSALLQTCFSTLATSAIICCCCLAAASTCSVVCVGSGGEGACWAVGRAGCLPLPVAGLAFDCFPTAASSPVPFVAPMQQQVLWPPVYLRSLTSMFMWHNTSSSPQESWFMFKLEVQYSFFRTVRHQQQLLQPLCFCAAAPQARLNSGHLPDHFEMPEEPAYQEGEFEHAPSHSVGSSSDLYSSRAEDEPAAASYAGSELVSGFSGLLSGRELWGAAASSLSAVGKGCGPLSPCSRTTVSYLCRLTGTIGHPHSLGARGAERMLWVFSSGEPQISNRWRSASAGKHGVACGNGFYQPPPAA